MDIDINKLHEIQLELLDHVYSICKENNLTCLLVYGTALGAYRHNGFIPWDDDVDVAMPREDYMKFLHIMKENEDEDYEIQDEDNEKRYFLSFAKVRKKGTLMIERLTQGIYTHNGIFIDVFPLDYVKDVNSFTFKVRLKCILYLIHILKFDTCKDLYRKREKKREYVLDSIASYPAKLLPRKIILKLLNRLKARNISEKETSSIAEYDARGLIFPYSTYFPPREITFENRIYYIPNKVEKYLTFIYGNNFMTPPPEKFRKSWKILEMKLYEGENQ